MSDVRVIAALFDLDGVVVFTDRYHYLGWKKLSDEMGWDFDEEVNHQLRGVSRMQSLQNILNHNKIDLPEDEKVALATKKNDYYVELLQNINEEDVYPGSIDFIKQLKEKGVRIALCSSSRNAELVLDSLGLSDLFEVIVTGHDITRTKPDPQIFQLAAEKMQLDPDGCIVFEDAESGVEAAYAAKMMCVGVGPAEQLPNAKQAITRYEEIDVDKFIETGEV